MELPRCDLCGEEFHLGIRCSIVVPEGRRHTEMLRVAWKLSGNYAFPKRNFSWFMFSENERRCRPPLPRSEMIDLIRSTVRKRLSKGRSVM